MKHSFTVDIGEKTCAKPAEGGCPPVLCPFVATSHYGTRFHCGLFLSSRELTDHDGWLMRSDECLRSLTIVNDAADANADV